MSHATLVTARRHAFVLIATALAALGCGGTVAEGTGAGGHGAGGGGGSGAGGDGAGETCDGAQSQRPCAMPGDSQGAPSGVQYCDYATETHLVWSACEAGSFSTTASTPLVLSFDGGPVAFAAGARGFDVDATMSVVTDWPSAATPWLALDRNGNGAIDDGGELFGSATVLGTGGRAANGFVALAELDSNGDGRITPEDAAWSSLRLWSDADGDRLSSRAELAPLAGRRVLSIELAYTSQRRCDARGNCEVERASFRWADEAGAEHAGAVVDVHLRHQTSP